LSAALDLQSRAEASHFYKSPCLYISFAISFFGKENDSGMTNAQAYAPGKQLALQARVNDRIA